MRRTTVLGAADRRRPRRRGAGHHRRPRLLAPRGPTHHARPHRGQHGRLRVHGAGRAGQASPSSRNWVPLEKPAGGPYFGKLDPRGPLLRQDRQHRRRRRGRGLPLAVPQPLPQPELVPVRGADGRLGQRPGPQLRPDVRPLQRDATRPARRSRSQADRAQRAGRAGQRRARRRCPNYAAVAARRRSRALPRRRQDVRRPGRRPVLRRPRRGLRRHQHRQARPARRSGSATRAAARTTSPATTSHSFVLQVPEAAGHARRQARLRREGRATRSSACGRAPSGGAITRHAAASGTARAGCRSAASATR